MNFPENDLNPIDDLNRKLDDCCTEEDLQTLGRMLLEHFLILQRIDPTGAVLLAGEYQMKMTVARKLKLLRPELSFESKRIMAALDAKTKEILR